MQEKLIRFLLFELRISPEQIGLALRHVQQAPDQLPMSLWQYGLINTWQLEQIFDWLETA
jgi:Protein of unknown function (DUF2949)